MISPLLHQFIEGVTARKRITAEDVKHLHRDLLADGIPSRPVADALLALDRTLEADPLWADFLTPAVVDFAVWGLRPTGVINAETANWLLTALTFGDPTPTTLRILEEIVASAHEVDPALLLYAWRSMAPRQSRAAWQARKPSLGRIERQPISLRRTQRGSPIRAYSMAGQSMDRSIDNSPIDLGVACLERAIRRMQEQNHAAAVADLRAALRYMQHSGADPAQAQHLASIIVDAEQHLGLAS